MREILLIILSAFFLNAIGQSGINIRDNSGKIIEERKVDTSNACNKENVYVFLPEMATYKEGLDHLASLLNSQLEISKKEKIKFLVVFLVNCEGRASGFISSYSGTNEIVNQTIKLLNENQNWNPGILSSQPVDSYKSIYIEIKRGKLKIK